MDGEATSWIRRANFSHTICYRMITPSLEAMSFRVNRERASGLKRMPLSSPSDLNSLVENSQQQPNKGLSSGTTSVVVIGSEIQRSPITNKKRSVSPSPQMSISDSFQEAKSDIKRFSTPHPRKMEVDKGTKANESKSFNVRPFSHSGPIKDLSTLKIQEKAKSKIEKRSSKSVDFRGSRVCSVGLLEEYLIDVSKVSYGDRFAHGVYSQLYHGVYKGEAVALKIIKAPENCEDRFLGARLEKQFTMEATLLSRLSHPNVVKVSLYYYVCVIFMMVCLNYLH